MAVAAVAGVIGRWRALLSAVWLWVMPGVAPCTVCHLVWSEFAAFYHFAGSFALPFSLAGHFRCRGALWDAVPPRAAFWDMWSAITAVLAVFYDDPRHGGACLS